MKKKSNRPEGAEMENAAAAEALDYLAHDNEKALIDLIRRQLAKPMKKRTHFLRKRIPGGSCL